MTQLTLFQVQEVAPSDARPPSQDPETAKSLCEWCQLTFAKTGDRPKGKAQNQATDRHQNWPDIPGYAKAKKALRDAIPIRPKEKIQ